MRMNLKVLLFVAVFCPLASAQTADQSNGLALGVGSNSEETYAPTSSICLAGDYVSSAPNQAGTFGGGSGYSTYDVKNLLTGGPYPDMFGWHQALIKSGSPESRFLDQVKEGENTISRTDRPMGEDSGSEMLYNPRLSDKAKGIYGDKETFKKQCGTAGVFKRNTGADILVNVQLSATDKTSCEQSLSYSQLNRNIWFQLGDIQSALQKQSLSGECKNIQVTISVLQRGGDIDLLPESLKSSLVSESNRAFGSLTCDQQNLDKCVALGKDLIKYSYSFLSQVTNPEQVGVKGGTAVFNYVFKPYDRVLR